MSQSDAARAVAVLAAAFPSARIEAPTLRVYAKLLADVDPEALSRAVTRLAATSRFFPTIAELRGEVAAEATEGLPAPEVAWGEVVEELRRVGHTAAPQFSCPEIGQAVRAIGGWGALCFASRNPYDRARFVDAYRAVRASAVRAEQLHGVTNALSPAPQPAARALVTKTARSLSRGEDG